VYSQPATGRCITVLAQRIEGAPDVLADIAGTIGQLVDLKAARDLAASKSDAPNDDRPTFQFDCGPNDELP